MNEVDFEFLLSPAGQGLLARATDALRAGKSELQVATRLRAETGVREVHAVLETCRQRDRAARKFAGAADMYFTREALEQASAEIVSAYRARRFDRPEVDSLADLCCGIGGDALSLARIAPLLGVDLDPVRLRMAAENLRVHGLGDRFTPCREDLLTMVPRDVAAFFFDPARRDSEGRRLRGRCLPPIEVARRWLERVPRAALKLSPLHDPEPWVQEWELISVRGEVREAVGWCGELATGARRRATLLPSGASLESPHAEDEPVACGPLEQFLYEPDRAVIRAHLVETLARRVGLHKIGADLAYLTGSESRATPFARCYTVEAAFPFGEQPLRRYLRDRGIDSLNFKRRGSPVDPDRLRRRLKLSNRPTWESPTLFLTRVQGRSHAIVAQAADPSEARVISEDAE